MNPPTKFEILRRNRAMVAYRAAKAAELGDEWKALDDFKADEAIFAEFTEEAQKAAEDAVAAIADLHRAAEGGFSAPGFNYKVEAVVVAVIVFPNNLFSVAGAPRLLVVKIVVKLVCELEKLGAKNIG